MSTPLPAAELAALAEDLLPKPDSPPPARDPMMSIARDLGWFSRPSEHEHRLRLERGASRR